MFSLTTPLESRDRVILIAGTVLAMLVVGYADYLTGYDVSLSTFYMAIIAIGTWFIGPRYGVIIAGSSVSCTLISDLASGVTYPIHILGWNAVISLSFYLFMVFALSQLRTLHGQLEAKVQERTAALTAEMAKRERVEKELLAVSEREQRRIGHDLHDSLCQHLTGTAMAGQVLGEKLAARDLPESGDADRLVALVEEGITLARDLARGLSPVELDAEGLTTALRNLAKTTTERFRVKCRLDDPDPAPIDDPAAAIHLFRIAQEAVSNAIRHGRAKNVVIRLAAAPEGVRMTIEDDGSGLPSRMPERIGMGLNIMQHRASMIGATFEIQRQTPGTRVVCLLPDAPTPAEIL